ncbi:glycosyltransferase family 4 protein [Sphingobacterium corticis]|uniref:Glycosyltransferase family 4 protein n=1 Tax=Sphingobacterium corticis TaxID=1812823 RepID=A0ABW5NG16_9SPHI
MYKEKMRKLFHTVKSVIMYPHIIGRINKIESNIIFFFPFYHTGGGEQVHADILNAVKDQFPVCILTEMSHNQDLKSEYQKSAELIELIRLGSKKSFRKFVAKRVARILNRKGNLTIFTCNSPFFDLMAPFLDDKIRKIDLIHTYRGDVVGDTEHRTLPYVNQLDNRVVLGNKQRELTIGFYKRFGLPDYLNERVVVIPNAVPLVNFNDSRRYPTKTLNILFVSRNGWEKRPRMFVDIAKKAFEKNMPFHFTMVGDFEEFGNQVTPNVTLAGRVSDKQKLGTFYKEAHVLLVTSVFEGLPMVILEGMSYGVVPISTGVGEIPYHVGEQSETGFIIDGSLKEDAMVLDFVDKITYVFENQTILQSFSKKVVKKVAGEFSKSAFIENYRRLILNK